MRGLRRPTAILMAIALAGGLAACGDDSDDDETGSGGTAAVTTTRATGSDAVDVVMREYSYTISGNLNAGGTIRLSNEGKEFHMMGLGRLKEGKTIGDLITILQSFAEGPPGGEGGDEGPTTTAGADGSSTTTAGDTGPSTTTAGGQTEGEGEGEGEEGGDPTLEVVDEVDAPGAFMGPGQKAEITVPSLGEGTYALVCFIPTEGPDGKPHFDQGMIGELTVVGDKAAVPTADATYRIEPGKPITGPTTLSAGKHILKFETGAGGEELEPGLAKLDAGKTVADVNEAFEAFEAEGFTLPLNAPSVIPADIVVAVFDFGPAREIYVGVDLTAGSYGIVGQDTDAEEDAPTDPIEKTVVTVT